MTVMRHAHKVLANKSLGKHSLERSRRIEEES
jgi:hypothetical protein